MPWMNAPEPNRGSRAESFLIDSFNQEQEWSSLKLLDKAAELGISRSALWEAKKTLVDIISIKRGETWFWWVPPDWKHIKKDVSEMPKSAF